MTFKIIDSSNELLEVQGARIETLSAMKEAYPGRQASASGPGPEMDG